jgi:hypothetical protein
MTACCYLAGTIPKELGQIPKLQVMLLQMNMHEGSIPAELGILANLTTFNTAFNRLAHLVDWGVHGGSLVQRALPPAADGGHRLRVCHYDNVVPQHFDPS